MAHWKDAVVTNDGVEMLNEWIAGKSITVTSAYGGTGTVDVEELAEQTQLLNPRQKLNLMGEVSGAEGKTIQVQVSNVDLTEEYELNQVGVFAKLDADKHPEAKPRMLFIMQDEQGVTVPPITETSFLLELYCMIGITNNTSGGSFHVNIDTTGMVTIKYLLEAIAAHDADPKAHPYLLGLIAGLDARLALLELMYTTDVSGNPFTVTFESLTGLVCTGVWNQALSRLEF